MRESPLSMRVRARDSLLVRCSKNKFSNFGHNSLLLGASLKKSLLFSLFFALEYDGGQLRCLNWAIARNNFRRGLSRFPPLQRMGNAAQA
jgi:hypothetical protein